MENLYQKFFSPTYGDAISNSYFTPKKSFDKVQVGFVKKEFESVKKNNIDNFFSLIKKDSVTDFKNSNLIGPKGKLIQGVDGVYKYIPDQNLISLNGSNPVVPVKLTNSDFSSFDNYAFMNSQAKEQKNYSPSVLQMQILNEKVRNIERQHLEEKATLLKIIESNIKEKTAEDETKKMNKRKLAKLQQELDEESDEQQSSRQASRHRKSSTLSSSRKERKGSAEFNNTGNLKRIIITNPKLQQAVELSDNEIVSRTLFEIKEEISKTLQEESIKNKENFTNLEASFKTLRNEMNNKIEMIDHKNKLAVENVRYVLERSGIPRLKMLTKKIFDGDENDESEEDETGKRMENTKLRESRRNGIKYNMNRRSEEEDDKFAEYIESKKKYNEELQRDLEKQIEQIDEDAFIKDKITSFKEKLMNQQKAKMDRLAKKVDLYKDKPFDYKPINHFRKLVYTIIGANRLLNIVNSNKVTVLNQSVKLFINYYESMHNSLSSWVFNCIRTPYISIINTEGLNINIASFGDVSESNLNKIEDVYLRLEIRLTGLMKSLYEDGVLDKLDSSLISYLSLIVTKDAFIPKSFFTLFEYSRIKTVNQEIVELNNNQIKMILAVYILVKILCKAILLDNQFNKNTNLKVSVKNNYKICASIIYRSVIDYFKVFCPAVRKINNFESFDDHKISSRVLNDEISNKKTLFNNAEQVFDETEIDPSYLEACKKYKANKKHNNLSISDEDKKALEKVIEKIPKLSPDTDDLEIEAINNMCYKASELKSFKRFAEKDNYDLSQFMIIFLEKLINKLEVKSKDGQ